MPWKMSRTKAIKEARRKVMLSGNRVYMRYGDHLKIETIRECLVGSGIRRILTYYRTIYALGLCGVPREEAERYSKETKRHYTHMIYDYPGKMNIYRK